MFSARRVAVTTTSSMPWAEAAVGKVAAEKAPRHRAAEKSVIDSKLLSVLSL